MPMPPLTVDNLRLAEAGPGLALQQRLPGADWKSLRPLHLDDAFVYLVGHDDAWDFYDAQDLVRHLKTHEYDAEYPLPEPLPLPPAVAKLPPDALRLLVRYAQRTQPSVAGADLGLTPDEVQKYVPMLGKAGVSPLNISDVNDLLRTWATAFAPRSPSLTVNPQPEPTLDITPATPTHDPATPAASSLKDRIVASVARLANSDPSIDTPRPTEFNDAMALTHIGPIRQTPLEVQQRIARRMAVAGPQPRIRWPFDKMVPGSEVTIPPHLADKAQRAAHVYAIRRPIKFVTARDNRGVLTVRCVARDPSAYATPEFEIRNPGGVDSVN